MTTGFRKHAFERLMETKQSERQKQVIQTAMELANMGETLKEYAEVCIEERKVKS
jgi:hypothetical protein